MRYCLVAGANTIIDVLMLNILLQHAFHGFDLNTYVLGTNVLILCGYALALIVLAALVLRRSTVAS